MQAAPLAPHEQDRLAALRRYDVLDTAPEENFDELTGFASRLCGAPIALISLVDANRQWFKARVGLDDSETPRDQAFCAHAIEGDDLLEVCDATSDPRFADNPLVTGDPHIRFYAGAPLSAPGGHRIGTLCVIDTVPRTLGTVERSILDALRRLANETLEGQEDEE